VVTFVEPREETVEVAGAKIGLLRGGQGAPLVWLHSVEGNLGWLAAQQRLAQDRTVFMPTHPGFSPSERPPWLETMADLARFYLWFLQELGLERVALVGHFMGGWLAAEMAVMCPHVVERLVLVDAAGIRPRQAEIADIFLLGPEETRRRAFVDPQAVPEYPQLFPTEPAPEQREQQAQNQEMAARLCWKPYMYDPTLPYVLSRLGVPALVVWGRHDAIVPLECGELYQQAIPGARLEVLDGCGHMPHLERAEAFAQLVQTFLA
jgi:pimeloyl-ACP methyl ester carboxylesterase